MSPGMAWFPRTLNSIPPEVSIHATCSNLYFSARLSQGVRPCFAANKVARFFSWVVKRATSLFNSFCSNVSKQVASFLLSVLTYLYCAFHKHVAWDQAPQYEKKAKNGGKQEKWRQSKRAERYPGKRERAQLPSPPQTTSWLASQAVFFFANADFFSFFPQCGAWSQANNTHANSEVQKPTDVCTFRCRRFKRSWFVILWLVGFDPFCLFLCYKVRCLWS